MIISVKTRVPTFQSRVGKVEIMLMILGGGDTSWEGDTIQVISKDENTKQNIC